ncbi:MAG: PspC domain-containing protein [Lachnospiraceae bacterium]|nr:PspC domain-containing protein [Lachnospiraceae bacterium]
MKYCRHCGSEMQDEAAVCVKCGISIKTPVTAEKAYCKACGAEMNGKAVLCTKCGISQTKGASLGAGSTSTQSDSLARSREGKVIAGVCSGFAKRFGIKASIIRVILIVIAFIPIISWIAVIGYVIAIFALPYED